MTREEAIDTMKHWFSDMLETEKERNSIDDTKEKRSKHEIFDT